MDNENGNNLYILNVNYVCIYNITHTVVDIHIRIIHVRTALYIHEQAVRYSH